MGSHRRSKRKRSCCDKHLGESIARNREVLDDHMSEDDRKALKRKRKLRDELHMLKHAKRIKLAAVEKVLAEARHENFRFGGERLRKQHGGAQDIFNRIKQGAVDPSNAIDDPGHYCEHCRCHLAARQPLLGPSYGNSCATAIRGLAAECARTEEELQLQLEALKAQLESKDKFRGKNLIPTVLHRLREYMEMTRKLHRRLLEVDKVAGPEEDQQKFAIFANGGPPAAANPIGPAGTANAFHAQLGSVPATHSPPNDHQDHQEHVHKHDLVEAIADAAKKVMDALQSLVNNSDQKIRAAFDFEKTFNREILPSTFAYALPFTTILNKFPKANEADVYHRQPKKCEDLLLDDALLPLQLGLPPHQAKMRGLFTKLQQTSPTVLADPMEVLKSAASNFFSLLQLKMGSQAPISDSKDEIGSTINKLEVRYWPDGRVPYVFDDNLRGKHRRKIWKAMDEYKKHTRILFVPRMDDDEEDYVYIRLAREGELCSSNIGLVGGRQEVVLSEQCMHHGSILHELNHALGFDHEHARADRDEFITVNWDVVKDGCEANFAKGNVRDSRGPVLLGGYDYFSVMHYPADAFSKYGSNPTIVPKSSKVRLSDLGQRWNFSKMDVEKINAVYGAPGSTRKTTES
jgi:hypothetical protein